MIAKLCPRWGLPWRRPGRGLEEPQEGYALCVSTRYRGSIDFPAGYCMKMLPIKIFRSENIRRRVKPFCPRLAPVSSFECLTFRARTRPGIGPLVAAL
jgi:hypothetical protein